MAYQEHDNWWTRRWLQVVAWRERHIKERNFVILLALAVGVICGFAAQLLKFLIGTISASRASRSTISTLR